MTLFLHTFIVGNAVPGVPSGVSPKMYRTAACGGRNAEDGVPYNEVLINGII
jgi:hypothetical protein